jgi:ATP adenylyltransferase
LKRFNLWAPWRIGYIKGLAEKHECFICHNVGNRHNLQNPSEDSENLVLWRTKTAIVMFNRFPYNNGHLLIAPIKHAADFEELNDEGLLEINKLIVACQKALKLAVNPHGFNVGMNFGRCAGAGLPGHLHIHIVPRWDGDTNFMEVCSGTDVISQGMRELYNQLKDISAKNNLPGL